MSYLKDAFYISAKTKISNLEKRNIEGIYCDSSKDMLQKIMPMLEVNSSVTWGGSESIKESGLVDAITSSGNYTIIDRTNATTDMERREIFAKTAMSDYFLMSTNAITLDGLLVNIDGNGNRVSALIHGPQHVYIIVGRNKVVTDEASAISRIKTTACPPNGVRLSRNTPCALTGKCTECLSPDCMCNHTVITRRSGHKGRIKVFLVNEDLGY